MRYFVILILLMTFNSAFALKTTLAKIDQISFIQELKTKRPDLVASDCKNNLILKLKYRKDVLNKKTDYQKIMASNYTAEQKAQDALWSENFRLAARKLQGQMAVDFIAKGITNTLEHRQLLDYFVADYDPASFVGYQVKGPIDFDKNGMMAKVFLSFKSALDDLNPDNYLEFTLKLSKAGYIGDSKVRLFEGSERFHFNNIIIHAASIHDALIAEKVAIGFFGDKLEATGRGFDVAEDQTGSHVLDWNNFLCSKSTAGFPKAAVDFLKYKK